MNTFETCSKINDLLNERKDAKARDLLITLLDHHRREHIPYNQCINHLIRQTGLYPYINAESASWRDGFALAAFKIETGGGEEPTLHREQANILRRLLAGENIALSAPTSFGKSFIIDAFLALKKPRNVMIIVPTIALMDEIRRRLQRKFGNEYKVITTTDSTLSEKNLFIFPQERAVFYVDLITSLDLLVVDEFYKASSEFDSERSPALLKAILKLSRRTKQRYYLAPNITQLSENVFTQGMVFVDKLDFNTVYLKRHETFRWIAQGKETKEAALLRILGESEMKSLIYAASYSEIDKVLALLTSSLPARGSARLESFSNWLAESYGIDWSLTKSVRLGIGIHNGQIHRSLAQIQLRLFEAKDGIRAIVSTSSVVEGVNTAAEAVILWRNRKGGRGNPLLDAFTFKNIIGRGGRMFKYFVGQIYLLEAPPAEDDTQLDIEFPDSILGGLDEEEYSESLSKDQISKIIIFRERMTALVGAEGFNRLFGPQGTVQGSDSDFILEIAEDMAADPATWNGLAYLNSPNPQNWDRMLYKLIGLQPGGWDIEYSKFVRFVKTLSNNWAWGIPRLLDSLKPDVNVDQFFKLERNVSYKLATLLHDVNELQKEIFDGRVDVSPFVSRLSHAFLPSVVYQLEEFGLPRMISRKIHNSRVFNFEAEYSEIHDALSDIRKLNQTEKFDKVPLSNFDRAVWNYFLSGISSSGKA